MYEVDESVFQVLLEIPLSRKSLAEKLKIIKDGDPSCPLPKLKSALSDKKENFTRNFQLLHYDINGTCHTGKS
jgi:hypothetical protein